MCVHSVCMQCVCVHVCVCMCACVCIVMTLKSYIIQLSYISYIIQQLLLTACMKYHFISLSCKTSSLTVAYSVKLIPTVHLFK